MLQNEANEFAKYTLANADNLFEALMASVQFEELGKGRQGTVLVKPNELRGNPIVRTTSKYVSAANAFRPIHLKLAKQIEEVASLKSGFNNALIENYTNAYFKMGAHSDLALDLEDDSLIALFSCYETPDLDAPLRRLVVEPKSTEEVTGGNQLEPVEIALEHNSVVVFSVAANRRFKHKIVLDKSANPPENKWLGITFRTSKTFVRIGDGKAYFEDGSQLTLASEDQRSEFFSLRGQENRETNFFYPEIAYTISESDLLPLQNVSEDTSC